VHPSRVSEQDPLWSKPCLAYNLHAELDAQCREDLADVQERFLPRPSWGALRCPARSLHLSVATVLSVRQDYGMPKDLIWSSWGQKWSASLRQLATGLQPFAVRFTSLQVSTAAVIAVADPVPEVALVRARTTELLSEAGLQAGQPSILHCTLVRYASSGLDLGAVELSSGAVELRTQTVVTRLVISKELVYPNLVSETLDRLQLG
jgi:hypothetical protein